MESESEEVHHSFPHYYYHQPDEGWNGGCSYSITVFEPVVVVEIGVIRIVTVAVESSSSSFVMFEFV